MMDSSRDQVLSVPVRCAGAQFSKMFLVERLRSQLSWVSDCSRVAGLMYWVIAFATMRLLQGFFSSENRASKDCSMPRVLLTSFSNELVLARSPVSFQLGLVLLREVLLFFLNEWLSLSLLQGPLHPAQLPISSYNNKFITSLQLLSKRSKQGILMAHKFIQRKPSNYPAMSLESRYDAIVKDTLSLLQEALYRFFSDKDVDVGKFKQYFCTFHKSLTTLEAQFHDSQTKYSRSMTKLLQLFQKPMEKAKFSLAPTPMKAVQPSLSVNKPRALTQEYGSVAGMKSLNVIGEEEEQYFGHQPFERRSGTAQGRRRSNNFTIDVEGCSRPKTGGNRSHSRYDNQNKTISYRSKSKGPKTALENTQQSVELKRERKAIYDELEKEGKAQILYQNMVKLPNKRSISTHRWSFKINKLF